MAENISFIDVILILFIFFDQAQLGQGKVHPSPEACLLI
jgi:hypothetical protein